MVASRSMMSRSRISPFFSRRAIRRWRELGERAFADPPIMSRPASMRLAMAISPCGTGARPTHFPQIHAHRIVGAVGVIQVAGDPAFSSARRAPPALPLPRSLVLDDVDAGLVQHRHDVFDLLRGHLVLGQNGVQLVDGDVALPLALPSIFLTAAFMPSISGPSWSRPWSWLALAWPAVSSPFVVTCSSDRRRPVCRQASPKRARRPAHGLKISPKSRSRSLRRLSTSQLQLPGSFEPREVPPPTCLRSARAPPPSTRHPPACAARPSNSSAWGNPGRWKGEFTAAGPRRSGRRERLKAQVPVLQLA